MLLSFSPFPVRHPGADPGTGLKDCLNMLLSCFRKKMSALESPSPRKLWNVLNAVTSAMNDEDETNAVTTI